MKNIHDQIGKIVYCPMLYTGSARKIIGFDKDGLPIMKELTLEELQKELKKMDSDNKTFPLEC